MGGSVNFGSLFTVLIRGILYFFFFSKTVQILLHAAQSNTNTAGVNHFTVNSNILSAVLIPSPF